MRAGKSGNNRNERGLCYVKGCQRKMQPEPVQFFPFDFKVKLCKQCKKEVTPNELSS